MNDPYKTLGVSPTATDDDIKKAYKKLARKYHPDNYINNPLSELAEEKMKEINEAYNAIQDMRSGSRSSSYTSSSSSSGEYVPFNKIRVLINQRRYAEADTFLDAYDSSARNAEWNYLKGLTYAGKGYYYEARQSIEQALYMDPNNQEYKQALSQLQNIGNSRNARYTNTNAAGSNGCSACDVCQGLICADCCCECMGGDLIRCC